MASSHAFPSILPRLKQGKNREIRKLMSAIGFKTLALVRTKIGGISGPVSQNFTEMVIAGEANLKNVCEYVGLGEGGSEKPSCVRGSKLVKMVGRGEELGPGSMRELLEEEVVGLFGAAEALGSSAGT